MRNPLRPSPAAPGFGTGQPIPEQNANFFSRLFFSWISPLLSVGFSRPLEKDDLWEIPTNNQAAVLTTRLEKEFYSRLPKDRSLPSNREHTTGGISEAKEPFDGTLVKALHATFWRPWWFAGILQLLSDTLKTTTPLLNKVLLTWLVESYSWYRLSEEEKAAGVLAKPRGAGFGIGLAFALFAMQEGSSLLGNHALQIGMRNGLLIRTCLIGTVFRKSLRLSAKARVKHNVGQITTLISSDCTRFDIFAHEAHRIWVSPIQLIIGFGLFISTLGYSALVGLGVIVALIPFEMILIAFVFNLRAKTVKVTDARVRLTTEILQGIRLIKLYGWEAFYIQRLKEIRQKELGYIRKSAMVISGVVGMFTSLPTIAAVMSFIVYSLTGHGLDVATIFTALQYVGILRFPLIMLPMALVELADVGVAVGRLTTFLKADELKDEFTIDNGAKFAIQADGDFTWETVGKISEAKEKDDHEKEAKEKKDKKKKKRRGEKERKEKGSVLPVTHSDVDAEKKALEEGDKKPEEEKPFALKNLQITVPRGSFVGIVGSVGSGKSSVLQALIGEMRRTKGEVVFSGPVAYVPQNPWIQNATVRDNIFFGQEEDDERLHEIIDACSLRHDIEILPQGLATEIGEKGINVSGGQKARISLARAAYSASEIVLLDDPLAAVDAHVGKEIVDHCLLSGPLSSRTRVLVTHALHILDRMDYVYVMEDGQIKEHGSYQDLLVDGTIFPRLIEEYGNPEKSEKKNTKDDDKRLGAATEFTTGSNDDKIFEKIALMNEEERITGSVSWTTYRDYLRSAGSSFLWAALILVMLTLAQGSDVGNNLMLGFWTAESIPGFTNRQYMAVYAGLGVANGVFSALLIMVFSFLALAASMKLFGEGVTHVVRSPISFFDQTPMGRVLNRLSKDFDTLDNELVFQIWSVAQSISSVFGIMVLVFYVFPFLGIIFAPLVVLYGIASTYYRRTSVETKRLDSILRSSLYASFSESLTGLATLRAYRQTQRAIEHAETGIDQENRAYYMTICIQRWLGIRLDLFGNILLLGIALFAAGFRNEVDPAKIGVVLSYSLQITFALSELVTDLASVEQTMNAAERIMVYGALPPEGAATTPNDPPSSWPENGTIQFTNVDLKYRPNLPLVLKNVSFQVSPGEKVGIVGRTGAGKTSLLQALFRTVELQDGGKIEIDGRDIAKMGLDVLRERLALVPQDSTLFLGTLRQNLDPRGLCTDAELINILQKAWLLPRVGAPADPAAEAKFSLDSTVGDEGSNFSAGERQLLALCRALVKNSRVIVLDEATSSVDLETDAKLQTTIQQEFASSTLLCIAHRLNTIAYYDRVLVMDQGQVAEFDTVLGLYDNPKSIFRSLCDQANLSREEIVRIREEHQQVLRTNIDS